MDSRPQSRPLVRSHRYRPRSLNPLLLYYPRTLQGSVSVSLTLSHPYPYHQGITNIPSLKYPPTSLPFIADSLPVMRFDVLTVALPPITVKTARLTFVLGARSLPLVTPNITAPFHVVVRVLLPIATTHLEITTFKILGSEVVPQVYNGGNVTE